MGSRSEVLREALGFIGACMLGSYLGGLHPHPSWGLCIFTGCCAAAMWLGRK